MEKSALIKALLKGERPNKSTYIFYWENHRVSETLGFFKFEVMDSKETVLFKIKIQLDVSDPATAASFQKIDIGQKRSNVGLCQLQGQNILSRIKEGFDTAVTEGRIPFFPGG